MKLDTGFIDRYIKNRELDLIQQEINDAHKMLEKGTGAGSGFLGWLHLPSSTTGRLLADIDATADMVRRSAAVFIVIGIGGSYLGSRAGIELINPGYAGDKPVVHFAGNSIDPESLSNLIKSLKGKDIIVNVISKSGTTTEPAIAFRVIMDMLAKRYSRKELKRRIICTTTKGKGGLWDMAQRRGYKSFFIPENVGGRFSVLTPVGLLPMAVSGIDIKAIIKGAAAVERLCKSDDIDKNPCYRYAAIRSLMYRHGKKIEILASFHSRLFYFMEWAKQLLAESEGKDGKGLFPATAIFSTDLHSIGQLIQEGERNLFETFLKIDAKGADVKIPYCRDNIDNLNYLKPKGVDFVNRMAYKGTALAHSQGNVPNMTLSVKEASAASLGELIYFFQRAVGISGYLLRINPFDQPGVEAYKKNMFRLLGKP